MFLPLFDSLLRSRLLDVTQRGALRDIQKTAALFRNAKIFSTRTLEFQNAKFRFSKRLFTWRWRIPGR